ncbi:MAG: hypothetical protein LBJ74_02680 [Heliobacteriaceae bacterium]|jgi:hypothetical protein|nr:hypothetical protein [Heliobacteriaceae bacterium]
MEISYYNMSGGVNLALTKTELGVDTKKIYWSDSENVEIFKNRGIIKQKGNTTYLELPESEKVTGMHELTAYDDVKLIITTVSGKIYMYNSRLSVLTLLDKAITGQKPHFANFLKGVLVITESDGLFYVKDNDDSTLWNAV